jgi:hypothetical protein
MSYKILRFFEDTNKTTKLIRSGLSLEEAQQYCDDAETSSTTCTDPAKKEYTKRHGRWFDGYTEE